jgi:hypothetical protein
MNIKILTVLLMVCITIMACVVCITVLNNNKVVENPLDGIILEIKENTLSNTGLTLIIKNVAPNEYGYGSPYWIEEKINDEWIPKIPTSTVWTSELRILSKNSIREEDLSWTGLYGELNPGNYRITKNFAYLTSAGIIGEYYPISAEFIIN